MFELFLLFVSLVLVAICGLFVMAEFALVTANRSTVEKLANKGEPWAKGILHALTTLSTQLSSAQVGITVTNLAIGFLAEPAIASFLRTPLLAVGTPEPMVPGISIVVGVILATGVTMVFGELIPKNLAIAKPIGSARVILRPLLFFTATLRWPIKYLNTSANRILKWFGVEPQEELASARSADELLSLVKRSAKKGTLANETAMILERSLSFGDQLAIDIMTPRVQVHAVQAEATVTEALQIAKKTGLSRLPVYGKNIDDIVGVMHIKHAFGLPRTRRKFTPVKQIMHPPILVPSTIELEPLLEALRQGGLQIAIVIDEFGGMDGIVTIEDVLEELVGEVRDEHDRTQPDIRKNRDGSWLLSGLLRPDEIAEQTHIVLPEEEDVETLGGLLALRLERMPKKDDVVVIDAVNSLGNEICAHLHVQMMDGNRVDRVLLTVTDVDGHSHETERVS